MGVRNRHSFHFPIQKFDDDIGLFKNFRYLEDYLQQLSRSSTQGYDMIIAPSDSVNKRKADIVLTGDATADETTMRNLHVDDGIDNFRFLDGTITGALAGNTAADRKQRNVSVSGLGPGVTTWTVPAGKIAIPTEDNTDPANADELMTSITGISFDLSADQSFPTGPPVWRYYMWNCEIFGGNTDGLADGDANSRGAVVWGNIFRDIGNGAGDHAIASPYNWIIANNYFANNNVNAIRDPRTSIITGNHFLGSNTAIDFVSSSGDNNVIAGNYFNTTTVFANFTAGANIVGLNWPAATATAGMLDKEAIHDNVASEISAIANKATPTTADFLIIEDAAATNAKKHITIANLQAILSHDSIAGVSADDHHAQAHTVASHSDTTGTGAELDTLTDGSTTALHSHTATGSAFSELMLIGA